MPSLNRHSLAEPSPEALASTLPLSSKQRHHPITPSPLTLSPLHSLRADVNPAHPVLVTTPTHQDLSPEARRAKLPHGQRSKVKVPHLGRLHILHWWSSLPVTKADLRGCRQRLTGRQSKQCHMAALASHDCHVTHPVTAYSWTGISRALPKPPSLDRWAHCGADRASYGLARSTGSDGTCTHHAQQCEDRQADRQACTHTHTITFSPNNNLGACSHFSSQLSSPTPGLRGWPWWFILGWCDLVLQAAILLCW